MNLTWVRHNERGQNLVLVAVSMIALLAMTALVLDGGLLLVERRRMQNAADAGAMAGARSLGIGNSEADATAEAKTYAESNGADSNGIQVTFDSNVVTVYASTTSPTFFAGIIGMPELTAAAQAEAGIFAIRSLQNTPVWPMAVHEENINLGNPVTMWDSAQEGPGQFGWLDFNGGSNPHWELKEWLENGFRPSDGNSARVYQSEDSSSTYVDAPKLDLAEFEGQNHFWIEGDPGNDIGPPEQGIAEDYIGEMVTVLVYDEVDGQGANFRFRIKGFAKFKVTDVDLKTQGHEDRKIEGHFVEWVDVGQGTAPEDFGLRTVTLTN